MSWMKLGNRTDQLWGRHFWGKRKKHEDLDSLASYSGGIYFIGCDKKIVYIGQSMNLLSRSIQSLAMVYHQVPNTTLPWSIGLSELNNTDDANELESSAIRKYAPIFNRSIPSTLKSKGKIPVINCVARVFADQEKNCTAFDFNNMNIQAEKAMNNSSPPWQEGFSKKTVWNSKTMRHEVKVTKRNLD